MGGDVISSYHDEAKNYVDFCNVLDLVCTANPYENMTHYYYRSKHLIEKNILSFYINYGYPAVKFGRQVFSKQFCSLQWKYYIENNELIEEYEQNEILRGLNTVVAGYPKMDSLAQSNGRTLRDSAKYDKTIIIAPHHTVGSSGGLQLSNFLQYAEFFQRLPSLFPNIKFVFRPHPLLFVTLSSPSLWGHKRVDDYLWRMCQYENVEYQNGGDYFETFLQADGIIHDCSSFFVEWLYTGKLGCYMLRSKDQVNDQFMPFAVKLMDFYHKAYCEDDVLDYIHAVLNEVDPDKMQRKQYIDKVIKVNYPFASKAVVDDLVKGLGLS